MRIALEDLDAQVSRLEDEIDAVRKREDRDRSLLTSGAVDAKQLADLQHELETLERRPGQSGRFAVGGDGAPRGVAGATEHRDCGARSPASRTDRCPAVRRCALAELDQSVKNIHRDATRWPHR
ncbi:hypothetical protein I551_2146 [Mycobacterium ulcerans str. Harvey]|uniref:CT398-like coiled coil hairpin domain-containing protein n=1 Tax=Mycobacterium ulcerans str. Harvey TaxID=1299332 RepID=A0ABN0R2W3_MYCUL|nr:hypothetical protein I551_2146 [Mycobacterium ulcerans str. Harvey]